MKVRPLDRADASAYQSLRLRALRESPASFSASPEDEADRSLDEVAARIASADGSVCVLGIFEHDELAGFLAVIHPLREKLRHRMELAGMYVTPEFRRCGFGRALLTAALVHAQSIAGIRQVTLGVNATNTAARALYRSVGFECFGVEPVALQVGGTFYDEEHYVLRMDPVDPAV